MASTTPERDRVRHLRRLIEHHNRLYHGKDRPEISDAQYDEWKVELAEIEARFPELARKDSPTRKVGWKPTRGFAKVQHATPMLSLEFTYHEADIRKFDLDIQSKSGNTVISYSAEPKLDGLAVSLVYEDGRFVRGSTRGDGRTGENVTANLQTLSSVPKQVHSDLRGRSFEVRGEVVMFKADLEILRRDQVEAGVDPSPNTRNAAAGSVRQLDPQVTASRALHLCAYQVFVDSSSGLPFTKHHELLEALQRSGFTVAKECAVVAGADGLLKYFADMQESRSTLDYDIDGVVFKVDDLRVQAQLGYRTTTPRFAIARKFPPDRKKTTVLAIRGSVGRTGAITPVVELEPVFVGGVSVRNATLHNEAEVHRKDVRVGDTVVVQRAGDVIPEIVEVVNPERKGRAQQFALDSTCPVCGSAVVRPHGEIVARCSGGFYCPAQRKQALLHFASRRAMNIIGLGESLVDVLVGLIGIGSPAHLYRLGDYVWDWLIRTHKASLATEVFRNSGGLFGAYAIFAERTVRDSILPPAPTIEVVHQLRAGQAALGVSDTVRLLNIAAIASLPRSQKQDQLNSAVVRYGEANASNLLAQIETSKNVTLDRVVFALGVREVGEETAKLLAKEFKSLGALLDMDWNAMLEYRTVKPRKPDSKPYQILQLRDGTPEIPGVGPAVIQGLAFFFSEPHNRSAVQDLLRYGVRGRIARSEAEPVVGPLSGQVVVFTGKAPGYSKEQLAHRVELLGGKVLSSVTKVATLVVYERTASEKYKAAKRLGIDAEPIDHFVERLATLERVSKDGD